MRPRVVKVRAENAIEKRGSLLGVERDLLIVGRRIRLRRRAADAANEFQQSGSVRFRPIEGLRLRRDGRCGGWFKGNTAIQRYGAQGQKYQGQRGQAPRIELRRL